MSPTEVSIRTCRPGDLRAIGEVCCRTGFGGDDIATSGVFGDRRLFALLASEYYVRYEADTSFVAVPAEEPERVVGYILGCPDTARYSRLFARKLVPRIAARAFFITSWRHPRTLVELFRWRAGIPWHEANPAGAEFAAHLHIDILPEYQRRGIGGQLLEMLESRFAELGVPGIHLVTSNYHRKSLPFYVKHGYRVVREQEHQMWSGISDYRSIVYVKRLAR